MTIQPMDTFLLSLGNPGRYQMLTFFVLWSNTYPIAFNNFVMVFYGVVPKHHCKILEFNNESLPLNYTIPFDFTKSPPAPDSCSMFEDPSNHSAGIIPCADGWDYDPEYKNRSIISEWDLVCDRKWIHSLGTSIYFIGVMLGGLVGGYFADRFGRQPVVLICIYLQTILGIVVAFLGDYTAFIAVRFFQAILMQALQACSFTLIMEMFQPKSRNVAGAFYSLAWTTGLIILSLVAYGIDKWWNVQLILSLPSLISLVYFWFVPESMRWLITHNKVDKAEALAVKIANFNKIQLGKDVRKQIENLCSDCSARSEHNTKQTYGIVDLVRTPQIRKYTIIAAFIWFTASIVTYGISYGLSSIASNIYISFVISGCIEFPLRGLSFLVLNKFGRRIPTVITLALSGVACIVVPIILLLGGNDSGTKTASTAFAIIGKAFMGLCYAIIPIYTVELYPTVIRTFGQGSAVFFSRIGGIVAPQLALLGNVVWKPAPFLICGIFGIVAALLTLMLPDTHLHPMPDMIEDVEARRHSEKKTKKKQKKKKTMVVEPNEAQALVDIYNKRNLGTDNEALTINGKTDGREIFGNKSPVFNAGSEEELASEISLSKDDKEKGSASTVTPTTLDDVRSDTQRLSGVENKSFDGTNEDCLVMPEDVGTKTEVIDGIANVEDVKLEDNHPQTACPETNGDHGLSDEVHSHNTEISHL